MKNNLKKDPTGASIARYFGFEGARTALARETVAGITTFVAMSHIIVVNPAILKQPGCPPAPPWWLP